MNERYNFQLSIEQRTDARHALKVLEGSGMSLTQAALRALNGLRASVHLDTPEVVERFNLSRVRKLTRRGMPLRPATVRFYGEMLMPLVRSPLGERKFDSITRSEFREWLRSYDTGPAMRAGMARACRALWRWALAEDPPLATEDATQGSGFAAPIGSDIARMVLCVEDVRKMLKAATWQRNPLALILFGGVRPEEVAGRFKPPLLWGHVNVKEKWIRVPAEIAKGTKARLVEKLPPTLWRWLQPGKVHDPISRHSEKAVREFARAATGVDPWPHDCLRHTCATYLLAATQDAGKVSEWLGWEGRPSLLHQTYRGRLTTRHEHVNQAMGRAFVALTPGS